MRLIAPPRAGAPLQCWRLCHLALHLLLGGAATLLLLPLLAAGQRARLRQLWSRRLSPCAALDSAGADRRQLSRHARSVIAHALFDEPSGNRELILEQAA